MARPRPTPRDHEALFQLRELFFSTTDRKGIILYGNEVFVRVSGYDSAALIGAAHNIIRHPDMPRCVFQLLWDTILAGRPIAAYVKNMAADGSYYWVLALVMPVGPDFVSIRLKPTTEYFATVRQLYTTLREHESALQTAGKSPRDAMDLTRKELEDAVSGLGFADYTALMNEIILAETSARKNGMRAEKSGALASARAADQAGAENPLRASCRVLEATVGGMFGRVESILALQKAVQEHSAFVGKLGARLHLLAINAQVRAAALAEEGRTLQVVAEQMCASSGSLAQSAGAIAEAMGEVQQALKSAVASIATSDMCVEMMAIFLEELLGTGGELDSGANGRIRQLSQVVSDNLAATRTAVGRAGRQVFTLQQKLELFIREVRTLEILHVTGKVEAVRCAEGALVARVFQDVQQQAQEARTRLTGLADLAQEARIVMPGERDVGDHLAVLLAA